jgi:hypothetical protein
MTVSLPKTCPGSTSNAILFSRRKQPHELDAALAQVYRPHYLLTAADAAAPPRLLPPSGLLACNDGKPAKNLSYLDHALTLLAVAIFRIRATPILLFL